MEPALILRGENTRAEYVSEHGQIQIHLPARLGTGAIRVSRTADATHALTPAAFGYTKTLATLPNDSLKCVSVPQSTAEDFSSACAATESRPKSPAPDAPTAGKTSPTVSGEFTWMPLRLAFVDAAGREEQIGDAARVAGVTHGNVLTYSNTFHGITERFTAYPDGLKHEVILLSRNALPATALTGNVRLDYRGLVSLSPHLALYADGARQDGDFTTASSIELRSTDDRPVLYMPPVIAYEQADPSGRVPGYYAVRRTPEGIVLSFGVPRDWLASPQRKYPVIVDPAVFIWPPAADALIWSGNPTSNYGAFPELWVGDPYRSLIRWDLSSLPNRAMIDSSYALIELVNNFGPAMNVAAHAVIDDWQEGGVTWNSRNGIDNWVIPGGDFLPVAENTVSVGTMTNTLHSWVLTDLVAEWPSGSSDFGFRPNYGILLQPETYPAVATKIFGAKEGSGFKPELDIFYTQGPVTLTAYAPIVRGVPSPDWYAFQSGSFWNAFAIRPPVGTDYDLTLYDTEAYTNALAFSTYGGNAIDYVVVDCNHGPCSGASVPYYPQAYQFSGRGTYAVEHATYTANLTLGAAGPYTMTSNNVVRVWDVFLNGGTSYYFAVRPISGDANLGAALHKSREADPASWYQGRPSNVAFADNSGPGGAEFLSYEAQETDWYGFVVINNGATTDTSYMIYIDTTPPSGSLTINNGSVYANSITGTLNISAADGETGVRDMKFSNSPSLTSKALVLQDSLPWGIDAIQQILAANNIPYDQLDSSAIPVVDLAPYSLVIIPSVQGDAFCNLYNSNLSKFANFAQNGGVLEVHGATYSPTACLPALPGGVVNNQDLQNFNYVVSPMHPVMAGVPNPFFGTYASHNNFTGYPANTSILATAGDVPGGNATLIEYPYGLGKVLASGQTLEHGWAYNPSVGTILSNTIPYAAGHRLFSTATTWLLPPPDGIKTVYGQFRNYAGMWSPVYTDTIVLDTQTPSSSATSPNSVNTGSILVMWTASDALSGVGSTALWAKFGSGGTWANTGLTQPGASGAFNYAPASGDGAYYFATVATDNASNVEAAPTGSGDDSTIYDTTAPVSSAASPATITTTGPITVMWTASDALSGVGSTALWAKFGSGGTWTNTGLAQSGTSGAFNYTPTSGNGTYYFATVATDNAGNTEATPTGSGDDSTVYDVTYLVYVPLVSRNHVTYFEGPFEVEPNNSAAEANGPLRSGRDYNGYPNDARDYFSIYLSAPGQINITLNNHTGGNVQLQLFYQTTSNVAAFDLSAPYAITYNGAAGWYYIYIFTGSNYNSTTPYTLRVTYP